RESPHLPDRHTEPLADQVVQRCRDGDARCRISPDGELDRALDALEREGITVGSVAHGRRVARQYRFDRLGRLTVVDVRRRLAPAYDAVSVRDADPEGAASRRRREARDGESVRGAQIECLPAQPHTPSWYR